jgi:hypothetical protein
MMRPRIRLLAITLFVMFLIVLPYAIALAGYAPGGSD